MTRSNYKYDIISKDQIIAIEDLNEGGTSLTNDIENVVEEIAISENIDLAEYKIVYKDSLGSWDGFNPQNKRFIFLRMKSKMQVLELVSKIKLETWLN